MTNETNARYEIVIVNKGETMDIIYCNDISVICGIDCDIYRAQDAFMRGATIALAYDRLTNQRFCFRDVDW